MHRLDVLPRLTAMTRRVIASTALALSFATSVAANVHLRVTARGRPGAEEPVRLPVALESGGRFVTSVPAAVLDLRFASEGLAPRYFPALDLSRPAVRDLGAIVLTPGASVAGWVSVPERRPSFANVA